MARKYMQKKANDTVSHAGKALSQEVSKNPGMSMETMRSMLMGKAMEDRSHRIDLPDAMREKMESAFGMNFGKVNLYESERVADAGANAIAQGGNIAFAPGKDDFNSLDGQRRLGHELSHIASQARGEVTGSGYLDNGALEARADREGALAAAGEQVYSAPMMDAPSFSAAAPMQADLTKEEKNKWKEKAQEGPDIDDYIDRMLHIKNAMRYNERRKERRKEGEKFGDKLEIRDEDMQMYQRMIANPTPELMERLSERRDSAGNQFLHDYYFKEHGATDDMEASNELKDRLKITDSAASSETFHNYSTMGQILDEIRDYHGMKKPEVKGKIPKRFQTLEKLVKGFGKGLGMVAEDGEALEANADEHRDVKIHNANIPYRLAAGGYQKYREGMDYIAGKGSKAWDMPALTKKEEKYDPKHREKEEERKKTYRTGMHRSTDLAWGVRDQVKKADETMGIPELDDENPETINAMLDRLFDRGKINVNADNMEYAPPISAMSLSPTDLLIKPDSDPDDPQYQYQEIGPNFKKALLERRDFWRDNAIKKSDSKNKSVDTKSYQNTQAYDYVVSELNRFGLWDDAPTIGSEGDKSDAGKAYGKLRKIAQKKLDTAKGMEFSERAFLQSGEDYGNGDIEYKKYQQKKKQEQARTADDGSMYAQIIAKQKAAKAKKK